MRKNAIPAVIAFAPALLLPLVQDVLRPRVSHASWIGFVLSWAPDLVVGFCFPFSILVRPRVWTAEVAAQLFRICSAFTVVALLLDEFLSPLGPNVFDPFDIAAGVGGVVVAGVVFHKLVRARLTFGDEERALGPVRPANEPLQPTSGA
jgi:hypothetical protein